MGKETAAQRRAKAKRGWQTRRKAAEAAAVLAANTQAKPDFSEVGEGVESPVAAARRVGYADGLAEGERIAADNRIREFIGVAKSNAQMPGTTIICVSLANSTMQEIAYRLGTWTRPLPVAEAFWALVGSAQPEANGKASGVAGAT